MPERFTLPSGVQVLRRGERWVVGYDEPVSLCEEEARALRSHLGL